MKILLVEDDIVSRNVALHLLSEYGIVDVATDGNEGWKAFRMAQANNEPYDLLVLDIMLPGISGKEILKNVRNWEEENKIYGSNASKIIMMTALDDHKNVMESFNEQCDAYLIKPITKDKIKQQMTKLSELR